MASASSFASRNYKFNVFSSFHGPDVRKTLLGHMREQFKRNGITMFNDQEIERCEELDPSLREAIRKSRISIVILSKKYASSSWCLDELVKILECKKYMGQIVMTIFYGVEPSDVRKQTGEFGIAFNATCEDKTDEERQKWSKALKYVANIAGEDFKNWDSEADMIKKLARDVSDKLNFTPSRDFDGMVGLEAHLREMKSLLDLNYDGVKMVGISGPAGIGKTTIARALQSLLSSWFQHTYFEDNLRESYKGSDQYYGVKLHLQGQLLSKVLNQDGIRIGHLGVLPQRLSSQRVLIILDDVNNLKQLEALAGDTSWFGSGSRIIVTTEDQELLQQHGIDNHNIYNVSFPSSKEALSILCRYAFKQQCYPTEGFKELAKRITKLCCNLPLGLRVVGSSLRGKTEEEWIDVMSTLENSLHQDIEKVLKVGYESLDQNEQTLFLYIAIFFNYNDGETVKTMLAGLLLDVKNGLKILVKKSLVEISAFGEIVMHRLLQQVAKGAIGRQMPWNRQILVDVDDICDVLRNNTVTSKVVGILFDTSAIKDVFIRKGAFERMPNLRFLKVIQRDGSDRTDIPEEIELPQRLRFLHWKAYQSKCLPPTFHTESLVKIDLPNSQLEKLWEGIQPLPNLKQMNLCGSYRLKELPDLSTATNLESLKLSLCKSLVELPSSISNLGKLNDLVMYSCTKLEVVPTNWTIARHNDIDIEIKETNLTTFSMSAPADIEVSPVNSLSLPHEFSLSLSNNPNLKTITQLPTTVTTLDLSDSGVETICCLKGLHMLKEILLLGCTKLKSLPELPLSLKSLDAYDCKALETVFCPLNTPFAKLTFTNCFQLGQEARNVIIHQRFHNRSLQLGWSILPGTEVPAEFEHRSMGNTLTFPLSAFSKFKVCLLCSSNNLSHSYDRYYLICSRIRQGYSYAIKAIELCEFFVSSYHPNHLLVFRSDLLLKYGCLQESGELTLEFTSDVNYFNVIECGVQILKEEPDGDEDGDSNHWNTHESDDDDDEADTNSDTRSESGTSEASGGDDSDDEEDYVSVSRKRPRNTTMTTGACINLKWGSKRRR